MILKKTFLIVLVSIGSHFSFSQNWDINTLRDINLKRNRSLDNTFKTISSSTLPVSFGFPVALLAVGYLEHDSVTRHKAIYIGSTVVISAVISQVAKIIIKRDRPFITYPDIQNLEDPGNYSFPSGHASVAFALATSVSIAYPKWYIIAPSFVYAGAVGYSRMHLGVHYPTDVIAGALVGAGSTYLSYKLNRWLFHPKHLLKNE